MVIVAGPASRSTIPRTPSTFGLSRTTFWFSALAGSRWDTSTPTPPWANRAEYRSVSARTKLSGVTTVGLGMPASLAPAALLRLGSDHASPPHEGTATPFGTEPEGRSQSQGLSGNGPKNPT